MVFIIGVVPLLLGLPWMFRIEKKISISFAYCVGFFAQFALFQIISIPIVLLNGSFLQIIWVYSFLLLALLAFSLYYLRENIGRIKKLKEKIQRLSLFECIYFSAFLILLCIQLVRGITYDITYMANDDGVYTVTAEQALEGQGLGNIHWTFGEAMPLNVHYGISGWLYYPAYISYFSGVSIATIEHTIFYDQLIILCYLVCWYMSGELFSKRENRLIFMLLIALFYWFGYHSHYSLTFRLLGPNYQGKAVLAVSLTPLILTVLIKRIHEQFRWDIFLLLMFLSVAACGLTLWGAGTIIVITSLPVLISMIYKKRQLQNLLYILAVSLYPVLCAGLYFLSKYAV